MLNYFALIIFTGLLVTGQIFFKYAAAALQNKPIGVGFSALLSTPTFYAAVAIYGADTLLWVWILSRIPLSQAYPWVAIATVGVPAIAVILFHERLHGIYWLGVALVVLGVFLTQRAAQSM
jgi:multidrug transporter EmrE-like cation transporter